MTPTLMQELTYQGTVNELLLAAKLPAIPGGAMMTAYELKQMDAAMKRGVTPHRFVLWVIDLRNHNPDASHPICHMNGRCTCQYAAND